MKYNKLVRDGIPELIKINGGTPKTHSADQAEYWEKLKEKLREETNEFLKEEKEEELADILEVIYAICDVREIDMKKIEDLRWKKKLERGGFKKKIILEEA